MQVEDSDRQSASDTIVIVVVAMGASRPTESNGAVDTASRIRLLQSGKFRHSRRRRRCRLATNL